ncbi:hypothetical protein Ciccas_004548 [Cichlidogyrus casuarinus]|uniref:Ig-like domain-containing protein n=1 Tax=Cichlidogyrus casuarinus TaxID=1844966 RepID=A0ABD2QB62_9PLAT
MGTDSGYSYSTASLNDRRTQLNVSNTVLSSPPQFQQLFNDVVAQSGHTVRLIARVSGSPAPHVWWSYNGETIDPINPGRNREISQTGDRHILTLNNIRASETGRYSITAENQTGVAACSAIVYVDDGNR